MMMMNIEPGRFFIGDPCYVLDLGDVGRDLPVDHMKWGEILEDTCFFSISKHSRVSDETKAHGHPGNGVFRIHGIELFVSPTLSGDGVYVNSNGDGTYYGDGYYSVDSGLIGIIPMELLERNNGKLGDNEFDDLLIRLKRLGSIVTFSQCNSFGIGGIETTSSLKCTPCDKDGVIHIGMIEIHTGEDSRSCM